MKLGGISLGGELGGYEVINCPATSLPQDLASAIPQINQNLLGATYDPFWLVGKQLVNGINYLMVAKEIRATKDRNTMIVGLIINIPPNEGTPKIVSIIEHADLSPELQSLFDTANQQLVGVSYTPVLYAGCQIVRGENHYFVCQAKAIYPNAQPYAVFMCINVFKHNVSIVSIEHID